MKENPFKSRRLKKQMYLDEYGTATKQGYFDMRKQFIMKEYPSLSDREANLWAADTRGMNYHDISKALELGMDVKPMDDYNTCDPETGNWTERILSDIDYIVLALKFGSMAMCSSGHYNEHNKGIKKIGDWAFFVVIFSRFYAYDRLYLIGKMEETHEYTNV